MRRPGPTALSVLLWSVSRVTLGEEPPAQAAGEEQPLSHLQVDVDSAIAGLATASLLDNTLPPLSSYGVRFPGLYGYVTSLAAPTPLLALDTEDFLQIESWSLGFVGAALALGSVYRGASSTLQADLGPALATAQTFALHQGFWGAYATYRDARLRAHSDAWSDRWEPETADRLIVAPLHWRNLDHPIVLVTLAGLVALSFGAGFVDYTGAKRSAPRAGPLLEGLAAGTLVSFDAAVTEEALFRGTLYEELQPAIGRWPARVVDMALFALAHVPGELGEPVSDLALDAGAHVLAGLLFEMASFGF